MNKTTIFLDIDGVINAMSSGYPKQNTGWREWDTAYVSFKEVPSSTSALLVNAEPKNGFRITYSPELLRELEALAARPDVDIVWLTTWCNDARTHLCPAVGLAGDKWDVLGREEMEYDPWSRAHWWKCIAARKFWELGSRDGQKFVWLDDDLKYQRDAAEWLREIGGSALAISPNSLHGLSVKHLEQIKSFIG